MSYGNLDRRKKGVKKGNNQVAIDLYSLGGSLPHFKPRDDTLENYCIQIIK